MHIKFVIMAPQIKCTNCTGKFGPSMFENRETRICRFCKLHALTINEGNQLREKLTKECNQLRKELKIANEKINSLTNKSEAVVEFVTDNVVGTPPDSNKETPTAAPVRTEPEFQIVRNNVRPKVRKVIPTTCQNRFRILADHTEEEEEEVRLVGDSLVRGQLTEFCARAPEKRKRFCIPGGGVDDVIASLDEVSNLATANTTYVIHVGTNDIQHTRSEELMAKYKKLIQKFKVKSSNLVLSGIIPRAKANNQFFNFATSTNRRLSNLCSEEGIGFVDTWDHFYHDRSLFAPDGIHLNEVGAARFGRVLNEGLKDFQSKNGGARRAPRVT